MKMLRQILGPILALLLTFGSVAEVSAPVTVAAGVVLGVGHAQAATPAQKAVVLNGVPGWVLRASGALPSIDMDFAHNRAWVGGSGPRAPPSLLTTTRASTGYAQWADGHLSSFGSNVPRITDLGLLVEQAATNVSLQSQTFDNASWAVSGGGVVTANTAVAPDGTTTADKLDDEDAAQVSEITGTATTAADTNNYTASIYFKKQPGATNYVRFRLRFDGSHACSAVVNLSTGVISANENTGSTYISSSIKSAGNYWYVTLTGVNASITSPAIRINPAYNTDGTNTASNAAVGYVEAWGAQLELGSFATSYIPTTTVAVARAADSVAVSSPSVILTASGTIVIKYNLQGTNPNQGEAWAMSDTGNNRLALRAGGGDTTPSFLVGSGSGVGSASGSSTGTGVDVKIAATWGPSAAALSQNGAAAVSVGNGWSGTSAGTFWIGRSENATTQPDGLIKSFTAFQTQVSNVQLRGLSQ